MSNSIIAKRFHTIALISHSMITKSVTTQVPLFLIYTIIAKCFHTLVLNSNILLKL